MTKEEKELLLKDLCARLPYGVICQFIWTYSNETTDGEDVIARENDNIRCIDIHTKEIQADYYGEWVDLEHCKPYLRPMTSMTEEEAIFLNGLVYNKESVFSSPVPIYVVNEGDIDKYIDYCNEHCLDWRYLIEKGLAIEAHKGMYKRYERD